MDATSYGTGSDQRVAPGRYHQYRRPPTGRPIAPRIHNTAPTTNKMIPIVCRIPIPVM
jgi:hypothetical protein